jgi:nucleotide-binding universal stress UspA family protein
VLEPPTPHGNLKTARKGLARYRLVVRGRAAHAGTSPEAGASAVEELAHQILVLKALRDPELQIVDLARLREASLIVVGSRGLGMVAEALLGSVANAVVHEADRPVLVVKRQAREARLAA